MTKRYDAFVGPYGIGLASRTPCGVKPHENEGRRR